MKCIRCGHDSKYKERTDKKCPQCQGEFAFEPQKGDLVTDTAFAKAIEKVSGNGQVHFYPEHLHYELARQWNKRYLQESVIGAIVAYGFLAGVPGAILFCILFGVKGLFIAAGISILAGIYGAVVHSKPFLKFERSTFDTLWKRWLQTHGPPAGLLAPKSAKTATPQPFGKEMLNYSFDRAVICDNPHTVDILLANQFHFEHNCAILTIGGYPPDSFDTIKAMLKNNPKLQVFVLHDATLNGCLITQQLITEKQWFRHYGVVIDVGLRPAQAKRFRGFLMSASAVSTHKADWLRKGELEWLQKYKLELAVIPPAKLLKLLYKAFIDYQDRTEGVVYVDSSSGGGGSSDSGGIDGFG